MSEYLIPTEKRQTAVLRIDHRCIKCTFYRVQAKNPGEHRAVLQLVCDAGANLQGMPIDAIQLGRAVRKEFNRQGWCYITDENLNKLAVK